MVCASELSFSSSSETFRLSAKTFMKSKAMTSKNRRFAGDCTPNNSVNL